MTRALRMLLAALACAAAPLLARADENKDLDLIPESIPESAPPPEAAGTPPGPSPIGKGRIYLEDAATVASQRDNLIVPYPPPAPYDWQNRSSLDVTEQWDLTGTLGATLSDRVNLTEQNDYDVTSRRVFRNDFREGFLTWEPVARNYLEGGRINLRNGVALGFNPTDFFKTRTEVDQASLDPSVIRQDRLGTMMALGQTIHDGWGAGLAIAPKLYAPTPVTSTPLPGFDPRLDRTNAADRMLLTVSYDVADLSPQALVYREGSTTRLGLNLSHPIGQSIIAYAEWAGGEQESLIERAIDYGRTTGVVPQTAPALLPTDTGKSFRNDLALGGSWTIGNLTVNLEYHYHQAGFSRQDFHDFFAIGNATRAFSGASGELWLVRGYASDQQEPLSRQQAFLRADWPDAFISHLELTGFAFINLYDGSSLSQLSARYDLSDRWSVAGYLSANTGDAHSERGSFPQEGSAILQLIRYF